MGAFDIPKPLAHGNNCIMMQYLGDDVRGTPTLHSLRLECDLAQRLFARVLWNVEVLLSHTYVHGDLSAHNILFHDDRAWLIDFPQAVSIDSHPAAYNCSFGTSNGCVSISRSSEWRVMRGRLRRICGIDF